VSSPATAIPHLHMRVREMPVALARYLRRATTRAWRSRGPVTRKALRWGEHCLAVIGGVLLVYFLFFDISVVTSGSMAPTLAGTSPENGDWVLTEKLSFRLRGPRRWEVMTFRMEGMQVMKRVVGLPGENVSMQVELDADGKPTRGTEASAILIDGERVERPESIEDIRYFALGKLHHTRSVDAGGGYVVLGDDSRDSWDSRWEPPVEDKDVIGRAWVRIWPPSRIGFVNP